MKGSFRRRGDICLGSGSWTGRRCCQDCHDRTVALAVPVG